MYRLLLLWALIGGGIATFIMIRIWLPRPVPILRYVSILAAGIVGGMVAGYLVHVSNSNPMPGIVASAAGALLLSGGVALLGSGVGDSAMS